MSTFDNARAVPRIGLSEEQAQLLEVAEAFCRDKSPVAQVRTLIEDDTGYDPTLWQEIAELGWLGIGVPENYGGIGLGMGELVPLVEHMGRNLMSTPFVPSILAAQALVRGGSETQKETHLPELAAGAAATLALCEDHADWDLQNLTAAAELKDGKLHLSGQKFLVLHAATAQIVIASVSLDGAPALVIIPGAELAERMRREKIIDDTQRAYALDLDALVLPEDALMPQDMATDTLAHIEQAASLLLAADMCGGAFACIDYTLDYLKTRKQFGKLIGSYQALKHTVVDAHQAYEKARSHLYSAAHVFGAQGEGDMAVHMAKAEAGEAYSFAADRAIQFHGGFGFTYDCDAQLYRRRAIMGCALHGDARYHRHKVADLMF
ncbi:MAG: acyl-CoA/acyl-ACP dehydrogenase [Alphaproteobacteria bacterium]|nr:acyl-CoA/acyl-ACP dehydrogenase [Alphaproteobacteria bacterium]